MFLNPVMLAGVGGAAVPLVLHFLSKSRFRTVDWGGMMFLDPHAGQGMSGAASRQWTLLALRMGIVSLLAVAMARPVVAGLWATGDRRLLVLVVDCSASMGIDEAVGKTRMELAREAALRILAQAGDGDVATIVAMGADRSDAAPPASVRVVAPRVATLSARAGAADVAAALTTALDICTRAGDAVAKEVFVICDRQARSWDGVNDTFMNRWQGRGNARLFVVPVGGEGMENVAVDSAEITDLPVVRGQAVSVDVRVHNYGTHARAALPVGVSMGGKSLFSTAVNVEPGAVETVHATVRFPDSGLQALTASIVSADLAADNAINLNVGVSDPLKVMLVGESPFIRPALAPYESPGAVNLAAVTAGNPADANLAFAGMNAVILANVARLPDAVVGRLEQFVYAGGGLVIAPGPASQIPEYARTLYRNGAGVMPASLRPATADVGAPTVLLGLTLDHDVFRFLRGMASPVPSVSVTRYFPADVREGDARVLATYATGAPFLVEGTFGAGRVLLVTTPLDASWSDLPLTNFYLPFVQSCVRYVARPAAAVRQNAPAGESDLTPLTEEAWDRLRHTLGMEELRPDDRADAGFLTSLGTLRNEMWLPLVGVVVAMLLAESLISRAWSEGGG